MATTPGRNRSGIPTPGPRLRSYSSSTSRQALSFDTEFSDRAFAEAIKANDPARHSTRSVSASTSVRSASAASNSRPKTPSNAPIRTIQQRSESRMSKSSDFPVGSDVRIESLGFEGKLRYVGEIKGKTGKWAGVELSGGFVGLGKNDGSVGDDRYFTCRKNCGVFIAYERLSPATVDSRPSSVASSRASLSGRITPSQVVSGGRVTPAHSNGRVTPSSRIAKTGPRQSSQTFPSTPSDTAMSKITAGSRASKYVGVTAKQLSARGPKTAVSPNPTPIGLGSPTRIPSSPVRPELSLPVSNSTPKLGARLTGLGTPKSFGSGRPSLTATPKARIPSSVAMPPPPSPPNSQSGGSISLNDKPATPTFSIASNDTAVDEEGIESLSSIQQNSRALQDKIQNLLSGKGSITSFTQPLSSPQNDVFEDNAFGFETLRSDSSLQIMQEKLDFIERENVQLKSELEESRHSSTSMDELKTVVAEKDQILSRLQESETQIKTLERALSERNTKIESLERSLQTSAGALESVRIEGEARAKDLQAKLDDTQSLITSLKEAIEVKANEAGENEGVIQAKNAEINLLEGRLRKADVDLEEIRRDLTNQIDELRHAGQETIALYEERLGAAETKRYQLEDLIDRLEEQLKKRNTVQAGGAEGVKESIEATRIDNEMLREQVNHLQKKISGLEEALEEARINAEREEATVRTRVQRFKDNETSLRNELTEVQNEIEKLAKSESLARAKAEEAEEALRENTLALENARAEIEGLRSDIDILENAQTSNSVDKARNEESSRRTVLERERHNEELAQLRELLEAAKTARRDAVRELEAAKSDALDTSNSMSNLKQVVESLDSEKTELEHVRTDLTAKLEREKATVTELRRALDEKTAELEASRKSLNRDRPINNGLQDGPTPSSTSASSAKQDNARGEIKGLKHIVQELQKESSALTAKNKLLESENKLLAKETESLREELKILEENIEQGLLSEENKLADADDQVHNNTNGATMKSRTDSDTEQWRRKYNDLEKKSSRQIHDLNKEVNELESLVEAKIYREDELEREIDRLKQKISKSRASKSSTSSAEVPLPVPDFRRHHSSTSSTSTINGSDTGTIGLGMQLHVPDSINNAITSDLANSVSTPTPSESDVCEICERPGHDIFSCPLLKDGSAETGPIQTPTNISLSSSQKGPKPAGAELFCEDCEGHGHVAADCPYSLDVF